MKYNIYDIPEPTTAQNPLLGKNEKKVLIVLNEDGYSNHFDLLKKIIGATGLNVDQDCAICQLSEDDYMKFSDMKNAIGIEKAIFFGIDLGKLGLQITASKNKIILFGNTLILQTFTLSELHTDNQKKRTLWNVLKSLFPVSE
jgi:hypothetical protein